MNRAKAATAETTFRSAREFEAAMFPRAVQARKAEFEHEHPADAGARLAEEALASLHLTPTK